MSSKLSLQLWVMILALSGGALEAFARFDVLDSPNYAWSENAGWVNFCNSNVEPVRIEFPGTNGYVTGMVWGENVGWIKLGSDCGGPYANTTSNNWGVNIDEEGRVSGFGWGENIGWLNFGETNAPITFNSGSGLFTGYVWSENLGWIHLQGTAAIYRIQGHRMWELAVSGGANGSVSPAHQWVSDGSNVTVTATAGTYYHFSNWTGTQASLENPLSFTMDQTYVLMANFGENLATNSVPLWWLARYGLATNDAGAFAQSDGDGLMNWQEYAADTDPTNSESALRIRSLALLNGQFLIEWTGGNMVTQSVERSTNFIDGVWESIFTNCPPTANSTNWIDKNGTNFPNAFYRVIVR